MASGHYLLALKAYLEGSGSATPIGDVTAGGNNVKVRLMRTSAYTVNLTTHQWLTDLATGVGTDATLGTKVAQTGADAGCLDAADAVWTAVASGAAIDCLAIYRDTGTAGTSHLLVYVDGFTVTPNGGDITIQWANTNPFIFKL